jgi:cell division protein FtsL
MQRTSPIIAKNFATFRAREITFTFTFIPFLAVLDMNIVHMLSQALSVAVTLATRRANVGFLARMNGHVFFHVARI